MTKKPHHQSVQEYNMKKKKKSYLAESLYSVTDPRMTEPMPTYWPCTAKKEKSDVVLHCEYSMTKKSYHQSVPSEDGRCTVLRVQHEEEEVVPCRESALRDLTAESLYGHDKEAVPSIRTRVQHEEEEVLSCRESAFRVRASRSVSYTHLTLPTICSV